MGKISVGMAAIALALSVGASGTFSAGAAGGNNVDNNSAIVCDYYSEHGRCYDENGDGLCDNYGINCQGQNSDRNRNCLSEGNVWNSGGSHHGGHRGGCRR